MIIELHLLQSFPASNLNRDDLGQPKSVTFGGVPRGRISSQCLKRSARQLFTSYGLDDENVGTRTKRLVTAASELLVERGRDSETAQEIVAAGLHSLGFGVERNRLTQYLLFVGRDAVTLLTDFCDDNWDALAAGIEEAKKKEKKTDDAATKISKVKPEKETAAEAQRIFDASRAADIALFGRMIADNTDFNVDAASQVAHAISTHAVATEFDYYTAVDDLKRDDEQGADMIGTIDFNAACYYRYANVDLSQLANNLKGDDELVAQAAGAWLSAFVHATPSGKQTTTAARTMPETLLGTVRERGAWNLANAFLRPVTGSDIMRTSTTNLMSHFQKLREFYGTDELREVVGASISADTAPLSDSETALTLDDFRHRLLTSALS
ncbi:type I-E CRISPR-associated protein Cas7/Cse4/CasC [Actinobacteria bacterium YIM 96077]|uniref:Type I-E CRISPR-associated protein Cas7/Cse4/CasC n=1 Tax=Phytoactinopolyspora halophila TaxID=1981511 RepID=A0A329QB44_9ACTN|nr:type I-E CRISPR-associated protein Cas7/Cse4/CasC [Phytoactinopolyspora halophila]AYY13726.1 type I-E CRISPR-associated protein Cas7/Cse4/CasC [Actinobacteria bacterium YIM 96077]RAW09457.1 type I-E CRISPR-associated protein Cas7/Cse4/CasC [Phytoactinopolyspora halophila]